MLSKVGDGGFYSLLSLSLNGFSALWVLVFNGQYLCHRSLQSYKANFYCRSDDIPGIPRQGNNVQEADWLTTSGMWPSSDIRVDLLEQRN
jgi:hypothetical protein